jgi:hypothetical protein
MTEDPPVWKITAPAPFIFVDERDAQDVAVLDAARAALPALEQVISLWPYPQIDIRAVLDLVRLLQEQASADASSRTE